MFTHTFPFRLETDHEYRLLREQGPEAHNPGERPEAQKPNSKPDEASKAPNTPDTLESRMKLARDKYADLKKYVDRHNQYPDPDPSGDPLLSAWERIQSAIKIAQSAKEETTKNEMIAGSIIRICRDTDWKEVHNINMRHSAEGMAQRKEEPPTTWKDVKAHAQFWIDTMDSYTDNQIVKLLSENSRYKNGKEIASNMLQKMAAVTKNLSAMTDAQAPKQERDALNEQVSKAAGRIALHIQWNADVERQMDEALEKIRSEKNEKRNQ